MSCYARLLYGSARKVFLIFYCSNHNYLRIAYLIIFPDYLHEKCWRDNRAIVARLEEIAPFNR